MDIQNLQQETQTLEHHTVAGLSDVSHKQFVIAVLLPKVPVHDVNDMAQASPNGRDLEDVNECAGRVGHIHRGPIAPDWFGAEHPPFRDMFDKEREPLDADLLAPHLSRGQDHGVQEDLLGQAPVLACRPSPDVVVGAKELRCNDPWILPPLIRMDGIKRYGCIETSADANQPSPLGEIGEEPLRSRDRKRKYGCSLLDRKRSRDAPNQRRKEMPIPCRDASWGHNCCHCEHSFDSVEDNAVSVSQPRLPAKVVEPKALFGLAGFDAGLAHRNLCSEEFDWVCAIGRPPHAGSRTAVSAAWRCHPTACSRLHRCRGQGLDWTPPQPAFRLCVQCEAATAGDWTIDGACRLFRCPCADYSAGSQSAVTWYRRSHNSPVPSMTSLPSSTAAT